MRTVGHRKDAPYPLSGSAALQAKGLASTTRFTSLPDATGPSFAREIYRFKTHEEANRHDLERIATGWHRSALERRRRLVTEEYSRPATLEDLKL